MNYLLCRSNIYYFNKKVPSEIKEYDSRKLIRFSLKTDSKSQAKKLAEQKNVEIENYWRQLVATGQKAEIGKFKEITELATLLGFPYLKNTDLAAAPLLERVNRILTVDNNQSGKKITEALLGGASEPIIKLDDALEKFFELTNDIILTKSPAEVKKWKYPRKRAIKYLIDCIGNKILNEVSRDDLLQFRRWWIERIEEKELGTNGANKNFFNLKTIISTVSDNYKLGIDVDHIFMKLSFIDDYEPRPPFETEYLRNVFLNEAYLKGMKQEHRDMLYSFAETGACFSELLGVLPEDIILEHDIPHIKIEPRKKKKLKTKHRKRVIPLVGFALDAFKRFPMGFSHVSENPDSVSAAVGKFLSDKQLFPSDDHRIYSLRHSFQDRLTNEDVPDRIQTDLMGHKFVGRTKYGFGGSLQKKHEVMLKIRLKEAI